MKTIIVTSLALLATACSQHSHREHVEIAREAKAATPDKLAENLARQPRKVYNHSVIVGGVVDSHEVQARVSNDTELAEHYKDINIGKLRPVRLGNKREAYVSYRNNRGIYWTAKPVKLVQDELILSDGTNEIRGRCGNRISDTPKQPVASREPEHSLDEFAYAPIWAVEEAAHPPYLGTNRLNRELASSAPITPELFADGAPTPAWFDSTPEFSSSMAGATFPLWGSPTSRTSSIQPESVLPETPLTLASGGESLVFPLIYPVPSPGSPLQRRALNIAPPPVGPANTVAESPTQTRVVPKGPPIVPLVNPAITPNTPLTPTPEADSIVMALLGGTFLALGIYKRRV